MDIIRGACSVDKVGGMVYIREDLAPSMLEWKPIDEQEEDRAISIPLNSLTTLQSTKETSPKMILKIVYKLTSGPSNSEETNNNEEEKSFKLIFTNRPTMNTIKDSLQTIVARSRTRVEGTSTPTPALGSMTQADSTRDSTSTPIPASSSSPSGTLNTSSSLLSLAASQSLSDANLLKNFELQQKLLLEDRELRDIFTKSVMQFKLSPQIFWSSRLNQLRTFALTISQHKGPYNVLSTIKPVATSDNQVNVNVTRDTINEIFTIYPIIKKAFDDLVPNKFSEGEFWSRFFNSKLFRRLRGDKISISNSRGDVVLDKYLYIDQNYQDKLQKSSASEKGETGGSENDVAIPETPHVNKFLDLMGNQQDNSQKLGNRPDFTMRYDDEETNLDNNNNKKKPALGNENEMIILMKNMNRLSSKMMSMSSAKEVEKPQTTTIDGLSAAEINEYEEELDLHDLNDFENLQYIKLNINPDIAKGTNIDHDSNTNNEISQDELHKYLQSQSFHGQIELTETYTSKSEEIEKTSMEIAMLIKQNFRTFKLINKENDITGTNIVPNSLIQEIITYNITIIEFLSHFWKIFLHGNNPGQLKKIFTSLKNCQSGLIELENKAINQFKSMDILEKNQKLQDKVLKDFVSCLQPMKIALDKACNEYVEAVRKAKPELNENGKRPLPEE
ncbi:RNA polymerase II transcription factor B subunit, putative [Candida dubliniensis CD36]|uniref:RNA polymerase II transcription factor B subunit, putative n=1 Tax=Candida dubliniensis (strain CD36 / ATCC MYA-646 / CBS 7987 / NCPF 3949 / NRRL Y-17841) TaxID=573826 RepID=B9WG78_CANDC|nr:RNA polymerase II transcription factor B subunit, putative [Candida dubliniensis CD36]CAX42250.1 RNA polymerase II transcription factor B subunit, putative [Candida dubliniensis CD36]